MRECPMISCCTVCESSAIWCMTALHKRRSSSYCRRQQPITPDNLHKSRVMFSLEFLSYYNTPHNYVPVKILCWESFLHIAKGGNYNFEVQNY